MANPRIPFPLRFVLAVIHLDTLALRAVVAATRAWERLGAHPEVEVPRRKPCNVCEFFGHPWSAECVYCTEPARPAGEMAVTLDADELAMVAAWTRLHYWPAGASEAACGATRRDAVKTTADRIAFLAAASHPKVGACGDCIAVVCPEVRA